MSLYIGENGGLEIGKELELGHGWAKPALSRYEDRSSTPLSTHTQLPQINRELECWGNPRTGTERTEGVGRGCEVRGAEGVKTSKQRQELGSGKDWMYRRTRLQDRRKGASGAVGGTGEMSGHQGFQYEALANHTIRVLVETMETQSIRLN